MKTTIIEAYDNWASRRELTCVRASQLPLLGRLAVWLGSRPSVLRWELAAAGAVADRAVLNGELVAGYIGANAGDGRRRARLRRYLSPQLDPASNRVTRDLRAGLRRFDRPTLLLRARTIVRYFARIAGTPPNHADEALATMQPDALADRIVRRLSGGEHARVSLATALVGQPDVLVLDEPTVGLDPLLRRDLWTTFRRLAARGAALLVSSHVMDEAGYCDDLLLLREGEIRATETPSELRQRADAEDLAEAFLWLIEHD